MPVSAPWPMPLPPPAPPLPSPFSTATMALQRLEELAILGELTRSDALAALRAIVTEYAPEELSEVDYYDTRSAELPPMRALNLLVSVAVDLELRQVSHRAALVEPLRAYRRLVESQAVRLGREEKHGRPPPVVPTDLRAALRGAQPDTIIAILRDCMAGMPSPERAAFVHGLAELAGTPEVAG